jgi:hypothetical protein
MFPAFFSFIPFSNHKHGIRILTIVVSVNLLKPTGYVMHHQFNIQQL